MRQDLDRGLAGVVTLDDIRGTISHLGLAGKAVCLHSSLRSFGWVEEGTSAVVDAFLLEGSTLLVPTFSWCNSVSPPPHLRFRRNAADYEYLAKTCADVDCVFDPERSSEIDDNMGAIPAAVLAREASRRGNHPLCSFAAVGPLANHLVGGQKPNDLYSPLETLANEGGFLVLAGVDLSKATLIHLAEKKAGRVPFRRWANGPGGDPMAVEAGGCSNGFVKFDSVFSPFGMTATVGTSQWRSYPADRALEAATRAIREDPQITHCEANPCERCDDLIAGGPILERKTLGIAGSDSLARANTSES